MILGVVADDFTGATDIASVLVRGGMRTVQVIGVPEDATAPPADAVVVALKSRTAPTGEAVRDSLAALQWLRAAGARQAYFKISSTFDSTPLGNIGPVAEALLEALDGELAVVCPAYPENGRTVFRGHLFVGEQLLSESGMRNHPLTPMTDANLVRVLQAQTHGTVGLLRHDTVAQGADALRARLAALRSVGVRLAVADAVDHDDLRALAEACADMPLVVGGAGVAIGLPAAYAARGWLHADARAAELAPVGGWSAAVSGSCSTATNSQVQHWLRHGRPGYRVDPLALARGEPVSASALAWARERLAREPVLVYATAPPDEVAAVHKHLGAERAGALVEACLAQVAQGLVECGVHRLLVAGGETAGAVVQALGVRRLRIGPAIAPGVPWTLVDGRPLLLALKSGNFGSADLFGRALSQVA